MTTNIPADSEKSGSDPACQARELGDRLADRGQMLERELAHRLNLAEPMPGQPDGAETTTKLAYTRTALALDRTALSAERTLQAWIRTTLAMIAFGFTLGKIAQAVRDVTVKGIFVTHVVSVSDIAYFLVCLGTGALVGAAVQHAILMRRLRRMGLPNRFSIPLLVAALVAGLGAFAFTALLADI